MAKRDIVTYNPTTQGFETDLGDNNAEIKGTGNKIFSVESGSTSILSVGVDNTSITLNSNLTASGDISGSALSTGSFGRVVFTKISGNASQLTNVNEVGHVSGAAQVAARISGAFAAGFGVSGSISGSATSTGSFGRVFANTYVGNAAQMTNTNEAGHFSGSAQLASDISGSFNKGFDIGQYKSISGSATSTGSFGQVVTTTLHGDASEITNLNENGFISGAAQLASDISGAFQRGFLYDGIISGSMTSTASFHTVNANSYVVQNLPIINTPLQQKTVVSSSAQLAADISGSFNKGFQYAGTISGSATSTGSFSFLTASSIVGSGAEMTNFSFPTGLVSGSAQLDVSGSFNKGFSYSGTISGSATSTGSFGRLVFDHITGDASSIAAPEDGFISSSTQIASEISAALHSRDEYIFGTPYSSASFFIGVSGSKFAHVAPSTLVTGAEQTMSIMSLCGTDHDPRLQFDCNWTNTNTLKGWSGIFVNSTNPSAYATGGGGSSRGVWSLGGSLPVGNTAGFQMGMANAALSVGGYNESSPADVITDLGNKYDGTVWSISAALNATRASGGSAGTQNAALIFGGRVSAPSEPSTAKTERYNGSTWSEVSDMSVDGYSVGGLGTQNAALAAGPMGSPATAQVEKFNGDVWSEAASFITNRSSFGMGGTYAGGLLVGGSPTCAQSELWNGTTWSETNDLPSGNRDVSFAGTSNAGTLHGAHFQVNGGRSGYEWDGTTWGSTVHLTQYAGGTGRTQPGVQGCHLFVGGSQNPSPGTRIACTQHFEAIPQNTGSFFGVFGNSYSATCVSGVTLSFATASFVPTSDDISGSFNHGFTLRGKISGSATTTGSFSKFHADTVVAKKLDVAAYTNKGLNTEDGNYILSSSFKSHTIKPFVVPYVGDEYYDTRQYLQSGSYFSCGSCTEFSNGYDTADGQLSIGRDGILNISFITSSGVNNDGNGITAGAWSAGPDMITGTRGNFFGQQNASVMVSGNTEQAEGPTTSHTQHYNGISWRRGGDILEAKGAVGGGQGYGHGEDDVGMGKTYTTSPKNSHLQYNGDSWYYMPTNLVNGRNQGAAGTQNAAVIYGGATSPNTQTEEWNGHTWDVGGAMSSGKYARVGAGSMNAAIAGGGVPAPAIHVATELYNGTTWSNGPNTPYSGADCKAGMGGTQNNALARGGSEKAGTWDGTAWATIVDLPNARDKADVSGDGAVGMVAGGGSTPGASLTTTLEWNNSFNTGSYLLTKKIGSNY